MRLAHLVVGEPGSAHGQAQLVERQVLLDPDGERQRHDLEVERAVIAGATSSKRSLWSVMTRVKTSMRPVELFGFALPRKPGREVEPLLELDQVRAAGLEHRPVAAQVDLVEDVVLQLALDRVGPGQEAAADAQGPLAQAQVEAGRLHIGVGDLEPPGVDVPGVDGPLEELAREHPLGGRVQVQRRTGARRCTRSWVPARTEQSTSVAQREGLGGDGLGHSLWTTWGRLARHRGLCRDGACPQVARGPEPRPRGPCTRDENSRELVTSGTYGSPCPILVETQTGASLVRSRGAEEEWAPGAIGARALAR